LESGRGVLSLLDQKRKVLDGSRGVRPPIARSRTARADAAGDQTLSRRAGDPIAGVACQRIIP
jgi:hypothetical protein